MFGFTYEMDKHTTITISKENHSRLRMLGYTGDSYNDIITRLLETVKVIPKEKEE
jgi:hypothetical protein